MLFKSLKKLNNESGSVTIEATISLSAFMFAIVTLLTIVNICLVQSRMSYAINTTAKELSQYSYLYSLTGLNQSQKAIYDAGKTNTQQLDSILEDINSVYNEIENLGNTGNQSPSVEGILDSWDSIKNIQGAGSSLYDTMKDIASDPKELMFGIVKLATNEGMDLAKSRLIAAPLSKVMCQKHLVDEKDGDVEAYLKSLGVVANPNGSYLDGLDFSQSTLFPNGSSEITVTVSYDVKVIPLLPLDFSFHFEQTAITQGWLCGEVSFQSATDYTTNNNIWTESTVNERARLVRHLVIADMEAEGYQSVSGFTNIHMYNKDKNQFLMISSMNPLYSSEGESAKTLNDIDETAIKNSIELLCGKMKSSTDGETSVTTKTTADDGSTTKTTHDCTKASNKIILVIPEDAGLKKKLEDIIAKADTKEVEIELQPSFGNGARVSEVTQEQGGKS